jgi:hypothetical protein
LRLTVTSPPRSMRGALRSQRFLRSRRSQSAECSNSARPATQRVGMRLCATLPVDLPGFTADPFPRLLPISYPTRCPSSGAVEMTSLPVRVSHQPALASLSPWRRCARPFPHSSSRRCSIDMGRELHRCRRDPHKEARPACPPVVLLRERRHPSAVAVLPSALLVRRSS